VNAHGAKAGGLEFPCRFPVKVMGRTTPEFESRVMEILRRHAPDLGEDAVRGRPSRNGRFVSLTVTFTAHSREQLDGLYRELGDSDCVDFVL
jgi:putative lipoic acid-binding regulatory protein